MTNYKVVSEKTFAFYRSLPILLMIVTSSVPLCAQFFLNGSAIQTSDTCYQLTPAVNGSAGSIWNPEKVDLNQSFEVVLRIFLGCADANGADGMVFGFQPVSTSIGSQGGGIGFQGIAPSLGIEFDTFQNTNRGDPPYDHLAVIRNGSLVHDNNSTLAGPVQISPTAANVEDCRFHDVRVSWEASLRTLRIYFDCDLRLTYTGDIVNEIFGGNPLVFWGFTAATGALNNVHEVCFRYTTFLDQLEDVVLCPGGKYRLRARGGIRYTWTPAAGLSDPNSPNPVASPDTTTTYQVEIQDGCGNPFYDDLTVTVAGDPVFFDLGPDTLICENRLLRLDATSGAATYQWSTGETIPAISVNDPGFYSVTVTRTDTLCVAGDWINVTVTPFPEVALHPDTILCREQILPLRATDPNATAYQWQDGTSADTFQVSRPGIFQVTVSNHCGSASDQIKVEYENCRQLYIPNVFSPDNDGINDLFRLYDGGDVEVVRMLRIFDRWGGLVYEAVDFPPADPDQGWNGTRRGEALPSGVYVYFVEVIFRDGRTGQFTGEVTLLR